MSYATVKKVGGLSVVVSNSVLDTTTTPHVVSNDVLDVATSTHTVFGTTVGLTPVTILQFDLYDNRVFTL